MFKIAYRRVADVSPFVYLPGADGLTLGMAVTLTSGALAKGTASVKPTHIIMGPKREDGNYPAIEVNDNIVFETTSTATVAQTVVGSAVTLAADALTVTATATKGVFKVLTTDGATTNSTVTGVFVEPASVAA